MLSLQQITDAWGNWKAKQLGTSAKFTSSTTYSDHTELDNYHQYQCGAKYLSLQYDGNSLPTNGSYVAYSLGYNNSTTVQQTQNFQKTVTTTQSFTISMTETLSIGIEISVTEGVPAVASVSEKLTMNFSLSSTQSATSTEQQSWTVDNAVYIPQESTVKCDMVINTQSYSINFTSQVQVTGCVAVWFNDRVALNPDPNDLHYLWFPDIGTIFGDVISNNLADTTGYTLASSGIIATAYGTFAGSQGISVGVTTTQLPLGTDTDALQPATGKTRKLYLGAVAAD